MSKFLRWGLSVVTMASVATIVLFVTGWGSAIASSVSSVIVTNPSTSPANVHEAGTANVKVTNTTALPVQETNTDADGNIKVHEQGTAQVNVTNGTLTVQPQIPSTGFSKWSDSSTSGGLIVGPFSDSTKFAITSVALMNTSSSAVFADIFGRYGITSDCQSFSADPGEFLHTSRGPAAEVPADSTITMTFPQPFITTDPRPLADYSACLFVEGSGVRVTIVGYTTN